MPPQLRRADQQLRRGGHPGCARRLPDRNGRGLEAAGFEDEVPNDGYWVGFTIGSIVYTVDLRGPPGSVSQEQALTIASTYYQRLAAG
jgi:hypothetical protein